MDEKEIHPPELSGDPKRNSFYLHCQVVEQMRPYAVCLHLCDERKDGRLDAIYADCSAAIGKKRCPALLMRQQEKEACKAIYFKERVRSFADVIVDTVADVVARVAKKVPSKSTPSRKSSVIDSIDTGDYASAINAAMNAKPATPAVEARAGESLLEMAKRMMSQSKN